MQNGQTESGRNRQERDQVAVFRIDRLAPKTQDLQDGSDTGCRIMSYYFLAASLPMLSIGSDPGITLDDFTALCKEHLSPDDQALLTDALSTEERNTTRSSGTPFTRALRDRQTEIADVIAVERAAKPGSDAGPYLREYAGCSCYIRTAVSEAMSRTNPLDIELALDRLRWTVIEELQGYDSFSTEAIIAYALKLRIACRWAALNADKGRETLEQAVTRLAESGKNERKQENTP